MANNAASRTRSCKHSGSSPALVDWLAGTACQLALQQDHRQLQVFLPRLVGYRLLQIGQWGNANSLQGPNGMLCRWVAACDRQFDCDLLFDGGRLPIASGSLDAVVLPHSLEQAASPYRLLREVDRVLCHRGQLLIQGFNPWSPWAQRQRLRRPGLRYPARRLVPFGRIVDWLSLLDYDVNQARRYAWGFPWASRAGLDLANAGWRGLPALLAPAYVVLARKRVMPVTPAWAPRRRRVHGQVAEPSARMSAAARKAA